MSQPELTVTVDSRTKTELAKNCKRYLSMTQNDESVRPVSYLTPCTSGGYDEIGWVLVPPHIGGSREVADRVYTKDASWEENRLGAERDNEQLYRTRNGVQERRFNGNWIKSLGLTEGKSSVPAHVHIFGHLNGIVADSLGYIVSYSNPNEYVVAVQTEYGPVPRVIRVVTSDNRSRILFSRAYRPFDRSDPETGMRDISHPIETFVRSSSVTRIGNTSYLFHPPGFRVQILF